MPSSTGTGRLNAFERLLRRLELTPEDADCFIGGSGSGGVTENNRLYGGLVLAQAAMAAARTVATDRPLHALHANFLRPGRPDVDIRFNVLRTKTGRSFDTRTVTALQNDKPILQMLASFAPNIVGVAHQTTAPTAADPLSLPNRDVLRGRDPERSAVIDVRMCSPMVDRTPLPPRKQVWLKPTQRLPDDPALHMAMLVYATDRTLLSTAWRPHADQGQMAGASLDHSVWLHEAVNFNDWLLFDLESPTARNGRGLVHGSLYQRDGLLVGNVTQQGTLSHRPWPDR